MICDTDNDKKDKINNGSDSESTNLKFSYFKT